MGNISVTESSFRVKIYDLSSGKSMPEYMEEAKKRKIKLKHLDEYANRIELI
jgi:ribosome biogenesis protein ENP2